MIPKSITDEINKWMTGRFYGSIQINFRDGKIENMNKTQSVRLDDLKTSNPETKIVMTTVTRANVDGKE